MIPYSISDTHITFFLNGKQHTINKSHNNFHSIVDAVALQQKDLIPDLINVKQYIARITLFSVEIDTEDNVRCYGKLVPDYLAVRILEHIERFGPDMVYVAPIIQFTEKLMNNPNLDVRDDLFEWLERGNMPIFPDGDFAAYKLVRDDFSPIHYGPYGKDQSPGTVVEMPRNQCNENRDVTCSTGLHFCSYEYLPEFNSWNSNIGSKVILLKINPEDVVAIPTDYNLSKGRCCKFYVVEEIDREKIKEEFGDRLIINWDSDDEDDDVMDAIELLNNIVDDITNIDKPLHSFGDEYTRRQLAERAIAKNNGNKTAAAKDLYIPRSTLYNWLKSTD